MKHRYRFTRFHLLAVVLAGLLVNHQVAAQDFDDAMASYEQGDFATAVREYRLLAEQGHAEAQHNLGAMYENGTGVPESLVEAYAWYSVAAAQGESRSRDSKDGLAGTMDGAQVTEAQALSLGCWEQYVVPF